MKKLLLLGALLTSMNASAVESEWQYHVSSDEITDEKSYIVVKTFNEIGKAYGIAINCDNETLMFIVSPDHMEMDGRTKAQLRIDRDEPITVSGNFKNNMWYILDHEVINKISDYMKRGNKLVVRIHGELKRSTKVINLSGFTKAYSKLEANCGK